MPGQPADYGSSVGRAFKVTISFTVHAIRKGQLTPTSSTVLTRNRQVKGPVVTSIRNAVHFAVLAPGQPLVPITGHGAWRRCAWNAQGKMLLTEKLFAAALDMLRNRPAGCGAVSTAARSVVQHPVRTIAAFFAAPFLAFKVARAAKNPARRWIAGVGLFLALVAAWFAGTLLGTMAAALLIASKVGLAWGIAFALGTTFSVILSVAFQIVVFNSAALFFLHMSSEEVVAYLRSLAAE